MRAWIFAFDIVLEAIHQLTPGRVADGDDVGHFPPPAVRGAKPTPAILGLDGPAQRGAAPLRTVALGTPHYGLARFEGRDRHPKDHGLFVEAELGSTTLPFVGGAVRRPPAA